MNFNYQGPIVLAILDGVGLRSETTGNAFKQAYTPFLDSAMQNYDWIPLHASGEAVGIPAGVMGNSEVGHNALGCGQIIKQGIIRINEAFDNGEVWRSEAWQKAINQVKTHHSTLHFAGIFSDGGVHSHIDHLERMLTRASLENVPTARIHIIIDGRDCPPQSEPKYIEHLENHIKKLPNRPDYQIASGGGRMVHVADRYESDWPIVEKGYNAIVHGQADYHFPSATTAIEFFRQQNPNLQDQDLPSFVIDHNSAPIGIVNDNDAFIYFDFRADRALEFTMSMTYHDFPHFNRNHPNHPMPQNVFFAGLTEYNSNLHIPQYCLVPPISISQPLNTFLADHQISQFAIAEAAKFGHITYYFNGNSYEAASGEIHYKIESDNTPFNHKPWMKTVETTNILINNLPNFKFLRANYAAGDMVGHFADLQAGIIAMETLDLHLARLAQAIDKLGGMMIITADHGNIEELIDTSGNPKTSHTTNPVPCIFYDNTPNRHLYSPVQDPDSGISNIAPTIATLLNLPNQPDLWRKPLIFPKSSPQNSI